MPSEKSKSPKYQYRVLRDTREKDEYGWVFPANDRCLGTVETTLHTGDYTLEGYEKLFIIERKGGIAEFAKNLVQKRFEMELCRLDEWLHPYLILEFDLAHIVNFPLGSGIPESKLRYLKLTPQFLMQRVCELQLRHKTRLIFAGKYGKHIASSLFKRICENVTLPA